MEMVAKVSKGSVMDQVYLPKSRSSFPVGSYVLLKSLDGVLQKEQFAKPLLYGVRTLEPVKMTIVETVFSSIEKHLGTYDNILITGSFVDKGFEFHDIDIVIVTGENVSEDHVKKSVEDATGMKAHVVVLTKVTLLRGIATDPLYQSMIHTCIARKRFLYRTKQTIIYKLLDLHLLRSEIVLEAYDGLSGQEKYYWTRNMVAIQFFLKKKKVDRLLIDEAIKELFNLEDVAEIKRNILDKNVFLERYKKIYAETFAMIMNGVRRESK